ncbi:tetratricopeptide repeat protein [Prochlorococcus sp. MIT 1300]|uniref:tetratricopeptide repeat protein n=1 Tax=Prochlorococcus sp. MIT 1300 TaxID=3096218 RepID=UPI002A76189D|nr:tetratricopeptide repeat protein [Prochlorococcus sp. MIT 1300]
MREHSLGNLEEASNLYKLIIEVEKPDYRAFINYGVICHQTGLTKKAEGLYLKCIDLFPLESDAYANLGGLLKDLGRLDEAESACKKAIGINPKNITALSNMGSIMKEKGDLKGAYDFTREAIKLDETQPVLYANMAGILQSQSKLMDAEKNIRKALELDANLKDGHMKLGIISREQGKLDEANKAFKEAVLGDPEDLNKYLLASLQLIDIPKSKDEIRSERRKYYSKIDKLLKLEVNPKNNSLDIFTEMFWLAYHNCDDDKKILESLGLVLQKKLAKAQYKSIQKKSIKGKGPIKIGICSEFLRNHTIGKLNKGLVEGLVQQGFEVFVITPPATKNDPIRAEIEALATKSLALPCSHEQASLIINNLNLDFLYYPDIGMSPYTYKLALFRLARIQVVSWGHPSTTGLNTIDYFISSNYLDNDSAQYNYSETLIRFSRIPCIYKAPLKPLEISIKDLIPLKKQKILLGIPQSLFKIHPDYDLILLEILNREEDTLLVLIEGANINQTNRLKERWKNLDSKLIERSLFLARMDQNSYLQLLNDVDILLDPFYFGGGNTFYESMVFGTPWVTMPTNFLRGRIAYACYKQMEIKNAPIANNPREYIKLCLELANNPALRASIRKESRKAAKTKLFEDKEIINEYVQFFKKALEAEQQGEKLPKGWTPQKGKSIQI